MDNNLGAKYRASRLTREQATERLRALELQPMLGPGELAEAYALAEKLGLSIEVATLDFGEEGAEAQWKPLARE